MASDKGQLVVDVPIARARVHVGAGICPRTEMFMPQGKSPEPRHLGKRGKVTP